MPWLSALGLWISGLVLVTALSVFFAVKYYWLAQRATERVPTISWDQKRTGDSDLSNSKTDDSNKAEVESEGNPDDARDSGPAPTLLFQALPVQIKSITPASNVDVKMEQLTTHWKGSNLQVSFNLLYSREDGGNQQGRIVILARGPNTLLAHPRGALNTEDGGALISIEKGEFFSVSRFRQTTAEFGPVPRDWISKIQVLIFDTTGKPLVVEQSTLEISAPRKSQPAPAQSKPAEAATKPTALTPNPNPAKSDTPHE